MKGNARPPLHEMCLAKRATLSLIGRDADSHSAAILSTSGCLTGTGAPSVDKKLLIIIEVAPDKSKGPGYRISMIPHKGGETLCQQHFLQVLIFP